MFYRLLAGFITLFASLKAFADKPVPWQLGMQEPVTPIMHKIVDFHNVLLVVIFAVAIFVTLLLLYVCVRFRAKNNPVPTKTSHNTLIEVIWTVVPVLILVALCVPSLKLLYYIEDVKDAEMTLKVVGNQWYWSYQYPDNGNIAFDSNILKDDELKGGNRLLDVDNRVVLPVDTTIRIQTTGADVIHNWAIPAFGIKIDAVPGRLNEGWTRIEKTGVYYGQCSELCGVGHGFMPIAVEVVSKAEFAAWVKDKTHKLADSGQGKLATIDQNK
ncbi:MAG: coxB [Rickettsiaceae bacterium]|jgi:cytochrome c oxidase subunit 2|nr:coxB [Rickettsiaceae bacterium]